MIHDISAVLEAEAQVKSEAWYLVHTCPQRIMENLIEGAVIMRVGNSWPAARPLLRRIR
jgi:hypothetical protein